ncbi:hypothetical protein A1O7_09326 [Cladophialophora yegresii CBS 114405]|uniref:Uncharacterized protein n=1 Tax=Cladophialophora yegresii CBS 114405 TaxID=1182544 RepID=W9W5Z5_9EURO|nr:uncharacterized protein A1O7_09326 [Cladophialophora yegresii CBS 114405]EXJ53989.1 hypothetical protein A1O7_09326 [Cladophialophora yegresii CBS 114405]
MHSNYEHSYRADSLFLEPPHSHDPSNVSHVAALPADMLSQLPEPVQNALWTLQESTSVVYASYLRLQALLDERFDRLTPLPGMPGSYSETSFFNYMNAVSAERAYLLQDAHPDWKHKARLAGLLSPSSPYANIPVTYRGKSMTVVEWMQQLSAAEALWIQSARDAVLPDFEGTVLEYQTFLGDESESESATPSEASFSSEDERCWGANAPVGVGVVPRKLAPDVVKPQIGHTAHAHELGPERIVQALQAL